MISASLSCDTLRLSEETAAATQSNKNIPQYKTYDYESFSL